MSLNPDIKTVLVIGPANGLNSNRTEYTVACYEACKCLKENGLRVILVFANESFQLAQKSIADVIYSEPYSLEVLKNIILKNKPDIILPVFAAEKGLDLVMKLGEQGFLSENHVALPWITWENIKNLQDHQLFKDFLLKIGEPGIPSKMVSSVKDAVSYAESSVGYPVLVKPVIENGKVEGIIVQTREELQAAAEEKLNQSTSAQIVIEKSISGWKQIQYSVLRDRVEITSTVCSIESLEPVENQNYKSVLICPSTSISALESAMLENGAKKIVNALDLCGNCNITFALKPNSKEYVVLDVDPTVNHAAVFGSRAVDYSVAKNSVLLACGFTISELNIQNENGSYSIPVQKQVALELNIGTPVMAIGATFEEAIMKACQTKICNNSGLRNKDLEFESNEEIRSRVAIPSPHRIFAVYEAIRRNILTHEEIYRSVRIDWCYLDKIQNIADMEKKLEDVRKGVTLLSFDLYESAKLMGFSDDLIQSICGTSIPGANGQVSMTDAAKDLVAGRKLGHMVCGYNYVQKIQSKKSQCFHSVYQGEMINLSEINSEEKEQKHVLMVGGNSDSYEYDANLVRAIEYFKKEGYWVSVINNCPFAVSTTPDIANRVYLESPTAENIMNIVAQEKPEAVYLTFAGEGVLEAGSFLEQQGLKLPGYNLAGKKIGDNLANYSQNEVPGMLVEVDILTDAKNLLIPAIVEKNNLFKNSDSVISVYPIWSLSDVIRDKIIKQAFAIVQKINIKGALNIEFAVVNNVPLIKNIKTYASKQISFVSGITKLPVIDLCCALMNGQELLSLGYGSGVYKLPAVNSVKVDYACENARNLNSTFTSLAISKKEALYKAFSGASYEVLPQKGIYLEMEGEQLFELPAIGKEFTALGYRLYGSKSNAKLLSGFNIDVEYIEEINNAVLQEKNIGCILCSPVFDVSKINMKEILCISSINIIKELAGALKSKCSIKNLEVQDINEITPNHTVLNFTKMNSNGNDFIIINGDEYVAANYSSLAIDLCKRSSSIGGQFLVVVTKLTESVPYMRLFGANGDEFVNQSEAFGVAARYCYEKNRKTEGSGFQIETKEGIHNLILYKKNNVVTSVCEKLELVSPDCENKQVFAGGMNYNASVVKMNKTHCVINSNFVEKVELEKFNNLLEDDLEGASLQFVSIASDNHIRMRTWNSTYGEQASSVEGACGAVIAGVMNGWCKKDQEIFVTSKGGKLCVRYTNDTLYVTSAVQTVYQGQIQL